jgi:hypothetical protein
MPVTLVSIAVSGSQTSLSISSQEQLTAIATYSDGSTLNVTAQCTWSTNTSCLSVTVGGMVTAVRAPNPQTNGARPLFNTTVSATLNGITGTMALTVVAAATAPATSVLPSYRSHRTQVLLNYFDISDQRVREEPYSIDAQLLNTAAIALDDSQQRIAREIASRTLATCPTGIDNRGLYYMVKLPSNFPLAPGQTLLNQVIGTINSGSTSQNIAVQPYDDRLPVPTGYIADPSQTQVAMANPVLFDVTGTGDETASIWNPQSFGPFPLPIPNILTFWLEGVQGSQMALNIFVQGEEYPLPVWADQQEGASETITSSDEGFFTGIKIWQNISSIIVRGLPVGVRLRCWQMPFNLPAVPDATRPYTHPLFRDVLFDRYWLLSTSENLLKELYMMDNFSTLEYVQSYSMTTPLGAIAVEPNTWGILGASGTSLLYWDRREPLPGQLSAPAMTTEPLYGLNVKYDISRPGSTRYAILLPVPYGSASAMSTWRYLVMTPDGNYQALLPNGSLIAYSGGAGWQEGTLVPPAPVSLALMMTGTYVFILECMGSGPTATADEVPYPNLATPIGNTYDLSSIVPAIQGIAYDVMGRLWVWTGSNAVAIKPRYDGYILDPNSLAIYLTDTYDSVSFE